MTLDQNDPRIAESVAAYQRGDLTAEAAILETLLKENPDDSNLLLRLGAIAAQTDSFEKGADYMKRALEIAPGNPQAINMLGWIYRRSGKRDEAKNLIEDFVEQNPTLAQPQVDLGNLYLTDGDVAAARACFEKAVELEPTFINAIVSLASLSEREHKFEAAKSYAEQAVALVPSHGQANITLARVELRLGQAKQAADRMHGLLSGAELSDPDIAAAFYVIGQAMEKLGEYDHAFYTFALANDTLFKLHEQTVAAMDSVLSPVSLDRIQTFFTSEDVSKWTPPAANDGPTPTFLLGFPRSGTTLLDQILNAHSAIQTMEENENLLDARNELFRSADGLESLRSMSSDKIQHYRDTYWSRVAERFQGDVTKGIFIDKMPLNTILLGLIYRLFPDAKIIFALRDPRDVVLSCFQQRFGINVAMYQLTKTDMAASYYDQVMTIGESCRACLPLDVHVVRYEDVVNDMQETVSGVLSFLGLEWEEEIASYRDKARERWITTPSAEQVIEPLYQTSMGKWRNYQRQIAPVLPALEPWVEKFGYEPT